MMLFFWIMEMDDGSGMNDDLDYDLGSFGRMVCVGEPRVYARIIGVVGGPLDRAADSVRTRVFFERHWRNIVESSSGRGRGGRLIVIWN